MLQVAYGLHMHHFLPFCGIERQWFDAYVWNYPQRMCVCVCVCALIHLTVIISTSVFDGSLHTDHMDAYICKYLMSSVYVYANSLKFICVCVRVSRLLYLLPFIFLSGWLNTQMPVV